MRSRSEPRSERKPGAPRCSVLWYNDQAARPNVAYVSLRPARAGFICGLNMMMAVSFPLPSDYSLMPHLIRFTFFSSDKQSDKYINYQSVKIELDQNKKKLISPTVLKEACSV